jgi:AcrR family transcriptional regulator
MIGSGDSLLTLRQLVELSGVAATSVHQYRRMGLLPKAKRRAANSLLYNTRHVRALRLIRELRDRNGLSLETIRKLLPRLLEQGVELIGSDRWDDVVAAHLRVVAPTRPPARLLAVARDAFARRGFDSVSVSDICIDTGIAKGSFYRYFSSKDEVFLAAARSIVDVIGETLAERSDEVAEPCAIDELATLLNGLAALFLEVVLRALHGHPGCAEAVGEIISGIGVHVARRAGIDDDDNDEEGPRLTEAALASLFRARFDLSRA